MAYRFGLNIPPNLKLAATLYTFGNVLHISSTQLLRHAVYVHSTGPSRYWLAISETPDITTSH